MLISSHKVRVPLELRLHVALAIVSRKNLVLASLHFGHGLPNPLDEELLAQLRKRENLFWRASGWQ